MSRIKRADAELAAQLQTFVANWNSGYLTAAGWTAAQYTAFEGLVTAFGEKRLEMDQAKAAYRASVTAKDDAKGDVREVFADAVEKLYATPTITNTILNSLGLPSRTTGSAQTLPNPVTNLVAVASASGSAQLRWKRNGNTRTALFLIQASNDGGTWTQIGQTLRTSFKDIAAPPGVFKLYRVVTSNTVGNSAPSNTAAIYPSEELGDFTLAA